MPEIARMIEKAEKLEGTKVITLLQSALSRARTLKDRMGEAVILQDLGSAYADMGKDQMAVGYFQAALLIEKEVGDRPGESMSLTDLGTSYWSLGQKAKALDVYGKALILDRELGDRDGEATDLYSSGMAYGDLGRPQDALKCFERALVIQRATDDRPGEAMTLDRLGYVYYGLSMYQKALDIYESALQIQRQVKDRAGEADTLNSMGVAYYSLRQPQNALKFYSRALAIDSDLGEKMGAGALMVNIGMVYGAIDQPKRALEFYGRALPVMQELAERSWCGTIQHSMGMAYESLGDLAQASKCYERALCVFQEVGHRAGIATALESMSRCVDSPAAAIAQKKTAINITQGLRRDAKTFSKDVQESYSKSLSANYRNLYRALVAAGRFPEAERVLTMLDGERRDQESRRDEQNSDRLDLNVAYTEKESGFLDAMNGHIEGLVAMSRHAEELRHKDRTAEETKTLKALEAALEGATGEYLDWMKRATEDFKGYKPNQRDQDLLGYQERLASTCASLTSQTNLNTAAITMIVTDKQVLSVLWLADGTKVPHSFEISTEHLNVRVKEVLDGYTSARFDPRLESGKLLEDLLGPLIKSARSAKVEVLMMNLDGTLRTLPWQAMWNAGTKQWLGDEFELPRFTVSSLFDLKSPVNSNWKVAAFGNENGASGSVDIPGAFAETLAIQKSGLDTKVYNGRDQFTIDAFRLALNDRANTVFHVASHFHLEPGSDRDSFLLMADGTKFTVRDMRTLAPFGGDSCELMVLSACQTAVSTGDGATIEGLAASTESKGPKAVIASLWQVDDAATQAFMSKFYELRASQKSWTKMQCLDGAARALREGKLEGRSRDPSRGAVSVRDQAMGLPAWTGPAISHPYYWAPFVLFGNWK